jgi:hypothetical protein
MHQAEVEKRARNSLALISINDEICMLHEKSNHMEAILKSNELENKKLENQKRLLELQISDLNRQLMVISDMYIVINKFH